MRHAILLPTLIFLLSFPAVGLAAPSTDIEDLGRRLQLFVTAMVRGDSTESRRLLASDEMFRPLRDSGDITTLEGFVEHRLPEMLASQYPNQRTAAVVQLAARVHSDSFGTLHLLAKFYPAPALFTFAVYKQSDAWWVLTMRLINGAEDVAGEVASLGPPQVGVTRTRPAPIVSNVPIANRAVEPVVPAVPARRIETAARSEPAASEPAAALPVATAQTVSAGVEAYRARDYRKAYTIWRKLAQDGVRKAQFHLGAMYMEGRLGHADRVKAYVWLSRAESAGYDKALALLSTLVPQMDTDELARARKELGGSRTRQQDTRTTYLAG